MSHFLASFASLPLVGFIATMALAQPISPPPLYRLPVHIVDCAGSAAGRAPIALVGTLFTGGVCYREYDAECASLTPADELVLPCPCKPNKYSATMTEYLLGNVRPRPYRQRMKIPACFSSVRHCRTDLMAASAWAALTSRSMRSRCRGTYTPQQRYSGMTTASTTGAPAPCTRHNWCA